MLWNNYIEGQTALDVHKWNHYFDQGFSTLAEFSSIPDQTHMNKLKAFRIRRKLQAGECDQGLFTWLVRSLVTLTWRLLQKLDNLLMMPSDLILDQFHTE